METLSPPLDKHERLQQRRRDIQAQNGNLATAEVVDARPALSTAALSTQRALPSDLIRQGAIEYDAKGQPKMAAYDPRLLAPNPQRGRVVDRNLDKLAQSLDAQGQQEAIIGRLITETDRRRWPDHFATEQLLVILKGHRLYFAQPRTKNVRKLRVELLLPLEGESDVDYIRRSFARACIKMMHSEAYTIFDKVNLYQRWLQEFALEAPNDGDAAQHFEISHDEARRLRVVAQLDEGIAQEFINSDRVPADEVVFHIANRPLPEQRQAYERFATLPVTEVRRLLREEKRLPDTKVSGKGRPRNYTYVVKGDTSLVTYLGTSRTPQEWQRRGGAKAFLNAMHALLRDPKVQAELVRELG